MKKKRLEVNEEEGERERDLLLPLGARHTVFAEPLPGKIAGQIFPEHNLRNWQTGQTSSGSHKAAPDTPSLHNPGN